jgi:hypothetical protein
VQVPTSAPAEGEGEEVWVIGTPVARGSRREIVEVESGVRVLVVTVVVVDGEVSERGGLVVVVVSEDVLVMFSGKTSKCVPRTLICTNGALANAVVIRST